MAFFPAFSLSMGERVFVNFGRWPLRYPLPGAATAASFLAAVLTVICLCVLVKNY